MDNTLLQTFNIDLVLVAVFLIMNLGVGLYYGRGVKNIQDYALGGRNFGTGALVATIVATWISGSLFLTYLTNIYIQGANFYVVAIAFPFAFLIPAYFLIPKMNQFMGKTSIAEAMGDIYGNNFRYIVAITGIFGSLGSVAVQFKLFGNIFGYFFDTSDTIIILIVGLIITIYSAFGGIRAVSYTDMVQFAAFGCVIPLLGAVIWYQIHDVSKLNLVKAFSSDKFNLFKIFDIDNPGFWGMIALFLYSIIPHLKPVWFQRVSMGKDIKQVKSAFIISAFVVFAFAIGISWIPFLLYNLNANIPPSDLFGYIIKNYSVVGLNGLLLVAITAMAMSTADSYINASSVLFANDLCKPLNLSADKILNLSKIFAFVVGLLAIALSFISKNLLKIVLFANSFYVPIITPIIFVTILGFRTSLMPIFSAMLASFFTVIAWRFLAIEEDVIAFGIMINLIFLFGTHYLTRQPGGWVAVPEVEKEKSWGESFSELARDMRNFSYLNYVRSLAPKKELTYVGFGIYLIIFTIATMYTTENEMAHENGRLVLTLYQICLVSGVTTLMYPIWPSIIKKKIIIQSIWPIVILVTLAFCSCFFVLVSDMHPLQFSVFTTNLIVTILLLGWRSGSIYNFIGFYFGYKLFAGFYPERLEIIDIGSPTLIFMYSMVLLGTVVLLFLKPKEDYVSETEHKVDSLAQENISLSEKNIHFAQRISDQEVEIERLGATAQKILNNVNHELRLPVGNVMNFAQMLSEGLGKYSAKQLKELSDEVFQNSNRLSTMILNMLDLATLESKKLELQKQLINFSELVHDRVQSCRKIYMQDKKIDIEIHMEENILVYVDPNYIRQTIDNLVINAINFSDKGIIEVTIFRKAEQVEFTIKDEGVGIAEAELYDIFTPFKMGTKSESKAKGRGVGLALCKAAVDAHKGSIIVESDGVRGAKFTIRLNTNDFRIVR